MVKVLLWILLSMGNCIIGQLYWINEEMIRHTFQVPGHYSFSWQMTKPLFRALYMSLSVLRRPNTARGDSALIWAPCWLDSLAEYPVVINVLLLSILLAPLSLGTSPPAPWPDTSEPVTGRLRPQRSERPARLSLEPTIGPSECRSQSARVSVRAETPVTVIITNHPDIRNQGGWMSLILTIDNASFELHSA